MFSDIVTDRVVQIGQRFGMTISINEEKEKNVKLRIDSSGKEHTFTLPNTKNSYHAKRFILREIVFRCGQRILLSKILLARQQYGRHRLQQQQECLQVCPLLNDTGFRPYINDGGSINHISMYDAENLDKHGEVMYLHWIPVIDDIERQQPYRVMTLDFLISNPTQQPIVAEIFPRSSLVRNGIQLKDGSPVYAVAESDKTIFVRLEFICHPKLMCVFFEKDAPVIGVAMYTLMDYFRTGDGEGAEENRACTTIHSGECFMVSEPYFVVIRGPGKSTFSNAKMFSLSGIPLVWKSDDVIRMKCNENGYMYNETSSCIQSVTSGQFDNGFEGEGCIGMTIGKVDVKMIRRECITDECYSGQYQLK